MSHQDEQQASTAFLNLIGQNNAQALSNFLGSFKDTAALKRLLTSEDGNENHNCLHIAAMNRSSDQVVQILLTKAAEVNILKDLLNSQDINGKTPLMQFLECSSTESACVDKVLKKSLELFAEDHDFAKKHLALKGNTGENEPTTFALACHCGAFDESHAEASKNAKAFFEILAATNLLAEQFTAATLVDALKCGVMSPETLQIFIAEANKSKSLSSPSSSSSSSSTGLLNALCSKAYPSSSASSTSVFFQLWSECASVDTLIVLTENLLANSTNDEDKVVSLLKEVHPLDGHNLIMAACNNFNFTTPNNTDKLFTFLFEQLERHDVLHQEFTRVDKAGWNVLFHACSQSQIDLKAVQSFFNTAEKKFNCLKDMLLHKDEEGRTVLMQTIADRNVSSSSTGSSEGEDNNNNTDNDKEILEVLKLILQKSQELDIFSAVLEAVDANNENAFLIAAGASEYKEAGANIVKLLIAQCTCKEHYDSWKQLESTVDGEENPKNALKKAMDGGNEKVQKLIADPDAFEHCVKWWKESQ